MKRVVQWLLLTVVIAAAAVKTYSLWTTTIDAREMMPAVIAAGQAQAPNQYRVLVPLLWRGATSLGVGADAADRGIVAVSIVFCYAALAAALYRSSGSLPVTALCLIAFYGAAASGFWFRYRDTFFDAGFTCLGMQLVLERRPAWGRYAGLSAVAALNRETWLFSLIAATISRRADAKGTEDSGWARRDVIGLAGACLVAAAVLIAVRAQYGARPYHYDLWQYSNNVRLLLVAGGFRAVAGQAVWFAGSGLFVVWLMFALAGRASHVPFVAAFAGSLLATGFLVSNWAETRIFIPAYAVMLVSCAGSSALTGLDADGPRGAVTVLARRAAVAPGRASSATDWMRRATSSSGWGRRWQRRSRPVPAASPSVPSVRR